MSKTVSLNPQGRAELLLRCANNRGIKRLFKGCHLPAKVLSRQIKTGAYLLKFPGVAGHYSVAATSVQE